ncbi:MAG: MFS transporter [Bordetella sp.]
MVVLWSGALVLLIALGLRHAFGLFLQPMSIDNGWGREVFALSIAIQNLIWGAAQPFVGAISDKRGAGRVIFAGALLYGSGLFLMAQASSPVDLYLAAGLLIGLGLAGTTFPVVFGVISRSVRPEKRSAALGLSAAIGSFGQFAMLPGALHLIDYSGWRAALMVMSFATLAMLPFAFALLERRSSNVNEHTPKVRVLTSREALSQAFAHRGFWLLSLGFFVCGFHVIFIATHIPAYLVDQGLGASVGTTVLALFGLFNIAGSYLAGWFGGTYSKPRLLVFIYLTRSLVITAFIFLPLTDVSAYLFGVFMGLLWLSTVPLTNGTVASIFGVENMSMVGGIVFFFHQVGAFLGGWLGGRLFDLTGSYESVWLISIGLGLLAAVLNFPINEKPASRDPHPALS